MGMLTLNSCEDYFDVSPKSQILTDDLFSRESGFYDQLTGVYTRMARTNLYGREMTFGFAEVLSQNYDMPASNMYSEDVDFNYDDVDVESRIDSIWSSMYTCIANLNIMLEYYDTADSSMFSDNHYDLYRGEALGLRAFLHFELMKGFAESPASNAADLGVPYVTEYEPDVTEQVTVDETMDLIIDDLQEALVYLKSDSLYCADERYDYSEDRRYYFNYYAAKQILARAYLWKGDLTNAAQVAEEVIADYEDDNCPVVWTDYTSMASVTNDKIDRIYSEELVFRLNINDMEDDVDPFFTEDASSNSLYCSEESVDSYYEVSTKGLGNDFRCLYGFSYDGEYQYPWKYHQYGNFDDMMPVIRKAEIYYIAAEAQVETDPERAVELLNEVRENRNITEEDELSASILSADDIQDEIFKEYRKEFLGEGQLFFYYKRKNASTIEGASVAANSSVYVWPMPENELEFGNRE